MSAAAPARRVTRPGRITALSIAGALADHAGNVPQAAKALGLGRSTLYKKMVALGL